MKIIENKDSKQLGIKSVTNIFDAELSQEVKNMLIKRNAQEKSIDYKRLSFKRDKNVEFEFKDYKALKECCLCKNIYHKNSSIQEPERIQDEFNLHLLH